MGSYNPNKMTEWKFILLILFAVITPALSTKYGYYPVDNNSLEVATEKVANF
jgi:hypothetical protein